MTEVLISRPARLMSPTLHVVGLALLFLVPGLVIALLIEWGSSTSHDEPALLISAAATGAIGLALWTQTRVSDDVHPASVYSAVAWTWVACSLAGALPLLLSSMFSAGEWDSALFESVSGFTATGSTVLDNIEVNGRGILMWRQLTQFYGGMGMVLLAVAVLPFLGVGGLELIQAEAPGPSSDRLTPRVSETAKRLWALYVGITVLVGIALFAVPGVGLYDSIAHALTTSSTGGFSPYSESIGQFDSVTVELVIMVGLVVGAVNFTLHWRAVHGDLNGYRRSADLHFFLLLIAVSIVIVTALLWAKDLDSFDTSLRFSAFNVVTLATSGGFGIARGPDSPGDFALWTGAAQVVLLVLMVIGGSIGSTAGGLKGFRARVVAAHARRGLRRARHPRGVFPLRLGSSIIPEHIVSRVLGFVSLFFVTVVGGTLIIAVLGEDLITAGSGTVSAMSNMGPALGRAGPVDSFLAYSRPARGVLMLLMLVGRLEIFAMLLMFVAPYRYFTRGPRRR